MKIHELLESNDPSIDLERVVKQKVYMEGQCAAMALAIHQLNPQRYELGFIMEYNAGPIDMYLDPDDFDDLDDEEKQEVQFNHERRSLVHAFVHDSVTDEYIDASGRHKKLPTLGYPFNATRFLKFPATQDQLIKMATYMYRNEQIDDWVVERGMNAFKRIWSPQQQQQARTYAIKYLGVEANN